MLIRIVGETQSTIDTLDLSPDEIPSLVDLVQDYDYKDGEVTLSFEEARLAYDPSTETHFEICVTMD